MVRVNDQLGATESVFGLPRSAGGFPALDLPSSTTEILDQSNAHVCGRSRDEQRGEVLIAG